MSEVKRIKCDGCGKIIDEKPPFNDIYHLVLAGKTEHNEWGTPYKDIIKKDFCHSCACDIKKTLEKLAGKNDKG